MIKKIFLTLISLSIFQTMAFAQSNAAKTQPKKDVLGDAMTENEFDAFFDDGTPATELKQPQTPPKDPQETQSETQNSAKPENFESPIPEDVQLSQDPVPQKPAAPKPNASKPKNLVNRKPEPLPQIRKKLDDPDARFRTETQYIEHPNAAKGLIKIDRERNYIYKVKPTPQTGAGSLRVGVFNPTELSNPDASDITFEDIYDEGNYPILLYDQEQQIFKRFGKFGWKWGAGLFTAKGRGRFAADNPEPRQPKEEYTLIAVPLSLGIIYRAQYWESQFLVPYIEAGADVFGLIEIRDDSSDPGFGGAPAAHASAGLALQLGSGAKSFLDLDRDYGINSFWLTAEYRQYVGLSSNLDVTGGVINGGLLAEF
jgi:hypothetical protein